MATSSYAAASLHAGNTTVAEEKISPTTDYPASVNVAFEPGGAVAASTVLKISLANAKFKADGKTYNICDATGTAMGPAAGVSLSSDSNTLEIKLESALAGGQVYTIQDDNCAAPNTALSGVIIPSGSQAGTVVTMTVDNKLTPGDPNVYATAPAITVKRQFSAVLTPATSVIDFGSGLKEFKILPVPQSSPYTTKNSDAQLTLISDESIADKVDTTTTGGDPAKCTGTLTSNDKLDIKITGNLNKDWTIKYDSLSGQSITSTDATNGYVTYEVSGDQLKICSNAVTPQAQDLTLAVDGNTVLSPRNFTAQITLKGGGGDNDVAAGYSRDLIAAGTTSHIWKLDSTQYYIPLIKYDSTKGEETYIKIQSKSTISGSNAVMVQILASDGSLVTYNAGTITSGQPFAIKGSDLVNAVTQAGKTVNGTQGFAAIVNINAPETEVFAYANICDQTGCKRIPVKTVNGTIVE